MNWKDFIRHNGESLIWKSRTPDSFSTEKEFKRWESGYAGKIAGCVFKAKSSKTSYWQIHLNRKRHFAHNIVWSLNFGEIPIGMIVDHIDGDGLNNSVENLRLVSSEENAKNKPKHSNNTSGTPGVTFDKKSKKWIARISKNGCRQVIYSGKSKNDAVLARLGAMRDAGYHENHGR